MTSSTRQWGPHKVNFGFLAIWLKRVKNDELPKKFEIGQSSKKWEVKLQIRTFNTRFTQMSSKTVLKVHICNLLLIFYLIGWFSYTKKSKIDLIWDVMSCRWCHKRHHHAHFYPDFGISFLEVHHFRHFSNVYQEIQNRPYESLPVLLMTSSDQKSRFWPRDTDFFRRRVKDSKSTLNLESIPPGFMLCAGGGSLNPFKSPTIKRFLLLFSGFSLIL